MGTGGAGAAINSYTHRFSGAAPAVGGGADPWAAGAKPEVSEGVRVAMGK